MSFVSSQKLKDLLTGFDTSFQNALKADEDISNKFAGVINAKTLNMAYSFADSSPSMRKWQGPKEAKDISIKMIQVPTEDWELTVAVKRRDVLYDNLGAFQSAIDLLIEGGKRLKVEQCSSTLVAGTSTIMTTVDNKAFFATDHPIAGGTQSNLISGSALAKDKLMAGLDKFRALKTADGAPIGVRSKIALVVPTSLAFAAKELVNMTTISTGGQNVLSGECEVVVNPYLPVNGTPTNSDWYLMDVSSNTRAVMWQELEAPHIVALNSPTDGCNFYEKEWHLSVEAMGNTFLSRYQLAMKFTA